MSPVVAINAFPEDHPSEHAAIAEIAAEMGARVAVCTHFADGGSGARELAEAVAEAAEEPSDFRFLYPDEAPLTEKIETIATKVYGADGVDYTPVAARQLATYERNGVRAETEQIRELLLAARDLWRTLGDIEEEGERAITGRTTFRLVHLADILAVTSGA